MDSYVLYSPGGASPVNLGSWIRADPGPDFDPAAVMRSSYDEGPGEGGIISTRRSGVRRFRFPLIVGSDAALGGLVGAERYLRELSRPGAFIDLQPESVASADAIRFDVIAGRWQPEYNLRHNAIAKRLGTLELDVQPYGYLPTWITLASWTSATVWSQAIALGSLPGDAPGQWQLQMMASIAGASVPGGGSWYPDYLAFGIARGGSLPAFGNATAASAPYSLTGTYNNADGNALFAATTLMAYWINLATTSFQPAFRWGAALGNHPYIGEHRLLAYMKLTPSQALPFQVTADVLDFELTGEPLASAAPVATLAPGVASGTPGGWGAQPSSAYVMLDLGVVKFPQHGSTTLGLQSPIVRIWVAPATTNTGIATSTIHFTGLSLIPLGAVHGIMPMGVMRPSIAHPSAYGSKIAVRQKERLVQQGSWGQTPGTLLQSPQRSALDYFKGSLEPLEATQADVTLVAHAAARKAGASTGAPLVHAGVTTISLQLEYRPRFQFLKGI